MKWNSSKENTDYVVKKLTTILAKTKIEPNILGNTISSFHLVASGVILIIICFSTPLNEVGEMNGLFYSTILLWLLIIASNYYFHGCILTRVERELYNNKEWFGPVTFLIQLLNVEKTKENANFCMKYLIATPFSVIMMMNLLVNKCYYTFLLLFGILTPLLFIKSQANIFGKHNGK